MELIEHYDYESTAATKRHGFLVRFSDFFVRGPEEFEGTLNNCYKYKKFEESYSQLLGILNELR